MHVKWWHCDGPNLKCQRKIYKVSVSVVMNHQRSIVQLQPHQWCNGYRTGFEYGVSWG
jgi:hypothetical protein